MPATTPSTTTAAGITLNPADLTLLALALENTPKPDHRVTAERLGIKPDAARKRWEALRNKIVEGAEIGEGGAGLQTQTQTQTKAKEAKSEKGAGKVNGKVAAKVAGKAEKGGKKKVGKEEMGTGEVVEENGGEEEGEDEDV